MPVADGFASPHRGSVSVDNPTSDSADRHVRVIKPVWWKRLGFWMGIVFTVQGLLVTVSPSSLSTFGAILLPVGNLFAIYGWLQDVAVALVDWPGDTARMVAALEEERPRAVARPPWPWQTAGCPPRDP